MSSQDLSLFFKLNKNAKIYPFPYRKDTTYILKKIYKITVSTAKKKVDLFYCRIDALYILK